MGSPSVVEPDALNRPAADKLNRRNMRWRLSGRGVGAIEVVGVHMRGRMGASLCGLVGEPPRRAARRL